MNDLSTLHSLAAPPIPLPRMAPGRPLQAGIVGTAEEARQVYALRYAANVADGRRGAFLDDARGEVRDALDDVATIFWVKDGDRVVATMRSVWGGLAVPAHYRDWYRLDDFGALPPQQLSFTSRLIIAPEYRRSRALPLLLAANYRHGRRLGARLDFMHAAPQRVGLYERLGYQGYRPGVVDTDVGCQLPMLLTADAHGWLAAIRSPFAAASAGFDAEPGRRDWFRAHCDPRWYGGMTANRLGDAGFAACLAWLGAGDRATALRTHPAGWRDCALFVARAGDTVARSREGFAAGLVQLSGQSVLRIDGAAVERHAGRASIEAFARPDGDGDRELLAEVESLFLCHPALPAATGAASSAAARPMSPRSRAGS